MLKFLRRYNKWILVIGGSLLMVAFVAPQAFQRIGGDPRDRVVASYTGGAVTVRDRQRAARELGLLDFMGLGALGLVRTSTDESDAAMHWLMLSRMAERAEMIGGPADGREFLQYAARQVASAQAGLYAPEGSEDFVAAQDFLYRLGVQQMEAAREALLARGDAAPEELDMLLARARGVFRMYEAYFETAKLSDLEAVEAARRTLDQVAVDYFIVRSTRVALIVEPPTEERMNEFFEKYRAVDRGQGPHGFGYLLRPAIRLEWMMIPREAIQRRVLIDAVEANAHWRQNRDRYPGEWADEQARVTADLRAAATDGIIDEVNRVVAAEVRGVEGALEIDEDGLRVLPEDWELRQPSLTAISLRVQDMLSERRQINIERPTVLDMGGQRFTRDGFERLTGFNTSSLQAGPAQIGTEEVCFSMRELNPEAPTTYQARLVYGPAVDSVNGDVYYFRVTEARPEQPPATMGEVRTTVNFDVARWNGYQFLMSGEQGFRDEIIEKGMQGAADGYEVELEKRVVVSRDGAVPPQGMDFDQEVVRNAILDQAKRLDPTKLATAQPIADRIVFVALPEALAVMVAEIVDQRPVSQELFRVREPRAAAEASTRLIAETPADWPFSYEALSRALDLRWRVGEQPEEAPEAEQAAQASAG